MKCTDIPVCAARDAKRCDMRCEQPSVASAGYAPIDSVSNHERKKIILRAEALRESIKQHFADIDHWNTSVRRSGEEPIDPDPDGKLKQILKSLDNGLRRERVKGA